MSTVAFGALTTRREKSGSGTSKTVQPPGLNSYIDILAALVPAEVLAIHALIIAAVTTTNPRGQTQITQPATLRLAFWLLAGLAVVLFVLGRQPSPRPAAGRQQSSARVPRWQRLEWQDLIRALIPPLAFVGWTMLEPTSVWNVVDTGMSSGTRMLIAMVGAIFLAAVTKALTSHSDNKPSPDQLTALAARQPAAQRATATRPAEVPQEPAPVATAPAPVATAPVPSPAPAGVAAGDEPAVPKWVY
jgi:hypothetical protein